MIYYYDREAHTGRPSPTLSPFPFLAVRLRSGGPHWAAHQLAPPPETERSPAAHRLPFFPRLPFPDGSGAMVASRLALAVGAGAATAARQPPDG